MGFLLFISIFVFVCNSLVLVAAEEHSPQDVYFKTENLKTPEYLTTRYFSNKELEGYMRAFTLGKCGEISRLFSIGESVEGVNLWVLEISNNPGQAEPKPNFKYVANMHGDEPSGRQLLLKLADWLCENYKKDKRATRIIDEMHLYIMPTMNPDGYTKHSRQNSNHVDLNRDFPDRVFSKDMKKYNVEPETKAIMDWLEAKHFSASANFHEGALVANYPWDSRIDLAEGYAKTPDDNTFVYISTLYAQEHLTMHNSAEFDGGIVNGNVWYPVHGSMQDYNYIVGNCLEITVELSNSKSPEATLLQNMWEDNKNALLEYALVTALGGLRGTVKLKKNSKAVIGAVIHVHGIDKDFYSTAPFGYFSRPLAPGTYNITISYEEYLDVTIEARVSKEGDGTYIEILMERESELYSRNPLNKFLGYKQETVLYYEHKEQILPVDISVTKNLEMIIVIFTVFGSMVSLVVLMRRRKHRVDDALI